MEREIESLKQQLLAKDNEIAVLKEKLALQKDSRCTSSTAGLQEVVTELSRLEERTALSNEEIMRYSRQLLLPELGVKGQLTLSNTSVLVVGCGGLGCPLAQYVAAAGIGRLGLLDYDGVELSNLHRQVLHGEDRQGRPKALSAAESLKRLNSKVQYVPYNMQLTPDNALQLIQQVFFLNADVFMYDIVADCSDNVPTRYLVNDACVLSGKPLVSASALRMEGQLTVYNYRGGPCYRCLYPKPPPPETVTNCSDGGVLGVVPGIMGCIQALEVLKIASGKESSYRQQMLLFDALNARFRTIKLRPKQAGCAVCGENPTVKALVDYEKFCGSSAADKCRKLCLLPKEQRISVQEYKQVLNTRIPHLLVDVRPPVEVHICHLPFSLNIPLASLEDKKAQELELLKEKIAEVKQQTNQESVFPVYVICKLGNDSQKAVQILQMMSGTELHSVLVKDIQGGLMAWARKIDPTFPQY
ncbi:adenylyltransferase and sulfurtransferase MOCS3 [Huso huso]|uniref:Adenylyltransferase and sulfurtransferase MOCS3 n=1 Tax=Huso huso TaxID=61971 RepID=A0ABR0ZZC9_HUSHU